jgi:hypothetical protein
VAAPVVITIVYDVDTGVIEQEEVVVEAWVASDAEYYRAIVEGNLEEVLGESYVEELEEREEWVDEEEAGARAFLSAVLEEVDDDYWEDDHWEEVSYDDEWFEEEAAEEEALWEEVEDPEVWFEEEAPWETEQEQEEEPDVQEEEDPPPPEDPGGEDNPDPFGENDDNDGSEETETPPDGDGTEDGTEIEEVIEEEELDDEPEAEPEEEEPDEGSETPLEEVEEDELPDLSTDNPEEEGALDDPPWEDEEDPSDEPEDTDNFDEEPLPDPDLPPEEEVDEEQVVEAEVPPTTTVTPPPTTTGPPPPTTTVPPPPTTTVPPPPTTTVPPPTTTVPPWDPYAACRGTDACSMAPGGFATWEDYDAANNPAYYDDWGDVPVGFVAWVDYTDAVESGEVNAEEAEEALPDFVLEEGIVVVYVAPVYVPTYAYVNTAVALQETISTSSSTAQTGTVTTTNVTTAESGILTHNSNDGHWHLDTTTETTTVATVTNTLVDTTTVVARTGTDFVSCFYIDGIQSGCSTQRSWNDNETTATAGDAYTQTSTTTAVSSATVNTEEGCSEGGWRGMGDWCMVQSASRSDRDNVGFTLTASTAILIDAETNLTDEGWDDPSPYGDPYIWLRYDTDSGAGIALGSIIEKDDDGGADCVGSACWNIPSGATDPDETPTITYCSSGGACSDGVPVIDNVSDSWDSRIDRTLVAGQYVVQGGAYDEDTGGWYRLTIREDD